MSNKYYKMREVFLKFTTGIRERDIIATHNSIFLPIFCSL